jgi:predicted DNA binding protein
MSIEAFRKKRCYVLNYRFNCPRCHGTQLITDWEAGQDICAKCGLVIEEKYVNRNPTRASYLDYVPVHVEIEVKIENKVCKVMNLLEELGINQFKVIDVRGTSEGIGHMVNIPQTQVEMISDKTPFNIVNIGKGEASVWFESEGCDLCETIISKGSFLVSGGSLGEEQVLYRFILSHPEAFHEIISELEEKGYKPKVRKMEQYKIRGKILTGKQELVLWHALKTGFFEYPRKINSIELSKRLGIVPSTLSEITRRGFRRLTESYFNSDSVRSIY